MFGVLHLLSQVLGGLAFAMLAPAFVGLVAEDTSDAETFLVVSGLTGFVSGAMFFALRGRRWRLNRVAAYGLVLAVWLVPPLIAAVPIMIVAKIGALPAVFESVSGYTTTGATVLTSVEALGPATIFWRAELQWLGGLMTLIMFAAILAPAGVGGLTARNVAILGPVGEGGLNRSFATARAIAAAYAATTIACIGLLVLTGMPAFDAICWSLSTVSTGGFMPIDGSIGAYANPLAELVVGVFMLVGATSIVWHRTVIHGRWPLVAAHRESYWVIGVALLAGILFSLVFADALEATTAFEALRHGLFAGISIVTTTGFEPWPGAFDFLPLAAVSLLALAGAATMSTAGGIKFYRLGGMFVQSMHELQRLVYPHSVRSTRFGSQPYDTELMKAIWASAVMALAVVAAAAALLALSLPTFEGSALAAISAFSNVGPLYPAVSENGAILPHYAELDAFPMIILIAVMIIGRIEVIALLGLLSLAYWRS